MVTGDAFNLWYDGVIRDLKNKRKCIDDVCGWAKMLQALFWDTVQFLDVTGSHGIIQNPKKFVWGRQELEFVGFWLTRDGIHPSEETCQAIREFPRPTDITGIWSWFGLVEQVSFAFSKTALMEPFRELFKPKSDYAWSDDLQKSFEQAKKEIIGLVAKGVKSFVLGNWLCLVTDWSRTGIGYVLWMKGC